MSQQVGHMAATVRDLWAVAEPRKPKPTVKGLDYDKIAQLELELLDNEPPEIDPVNPFSVAANRQWHYRHRAAMARFDELQARRAVD